MTISLLKIIIHWLSSFPSDTGISSTMRPATIVKGHLRPNLSQNHIIFGAHIMVHTGTVNNIKARNIPIFALKALKTWRINDHDYHFRKKILAMKWV